MEDNIHCPLVDNEIIDISDCIENVDIVSGMIKKECMPDRFKKHEKWMEICQNCKYHNM